MINLLFVLPWLGIGGSEHVVLELARGLDKTRFRSIIFAIKPGPLETRFKQERLDTVISKKQPGQGHLQLMAQIHGTIKKYDIDIVLPHHMTSLFYSFFPARIFNRTGLYFTEHSVSDIKLLSFPLRLVAVMVILFSSGCIAISREIADCYRTSLLVNPGKIVEIPNAVDLHKFEKRVDRPAKKMSLGINSEDLVIGSVANLKQVKNHGNLISAFQQLHSKLSNVTLVLVGSGPLENNLKSLSKKLGIAEKVKFLGHRDDIRELYQVFDIFCLSSFAEGFPLSILEAMACKLPVIATDVSGNNEIIESGKNGLLVPSDSPTELADALILFARDGDLRIHLGIKGYETVSSQYCSDKWIGKYDALFSKMIGGGRGS